MNNAQHAERTAALIEEYHWLKTFNWSDERIATRLGLSLDSMHTMLRRHEQKAAA